MRLPSFPSVRLVLSAVLFLSVLPWPATVALAAQGTPEFVDPQYSVTEGAGSASIAIRRVDGSDGALTVSITTVDDEDGPCADSGAIAQANVDYKPKSGEQVTFADGATTTSFSVDEIRSENATVEPSKCIGLQMRAVGSETFAFAKLIINDNDTASGGTVDLAVKTEGQATVTVNSSVNYTHTVKNLGPDTATNVQLVAVYTPPVRPGGSRGRSRAEGRRTAGGGHLRLDSNVGRLHHRLGTRG